MQDCGESHTPDYIGEADFERLLAMRLGGGAGSCPEPPPRRKTLSQSTVAVVRIHG